MSPLRIAFVITRSDAIGGAQIHVRDLAGALHDEGHAVRVFVGGQGPFVEALQARGVEVEPLRHLVAPLRPLTDARAVVELRRALVRFGPKLVTLHSSKAGALGRLATRGLGAKVVYTAHGWPFVDAVPPVQAAVYRRVEQLAAPLCDRIITVSEHDLDLARRAGVGTAAQLVRVHNGVHDVAASLQARPGEGPPRLVVVARLDVPKDPFTLLRALSALSAQPWTLEWIGDGPRRAAAEQLAAALGLADRCRFVGARDDVAERLAQASILVLPTDREGLPLCVLEGMRAGLPVVASAVGGIPEAVLPGRTGFLVPPADARALARALASLLDDAALRTRLGAEGRRRYLDCFSFAQQRAATLDVYRSLLSVPSSSTPTRSSDAHAARVLFL
jgi:glycosyltransferase involved in cell wall biosynthesis